MAPTMKRTTLCLVLIACLLFVTIPKMDVAKAEASMIVVPDDYDSIQEAINVANDGDTVFVKAGTYNGSVTIDKSLSLIGEDKETTTIIGDWSLNGTTVLVEHDSVSVTNLTLKSVIGSDLIGRGIHLLHVRYCHVSNCNFILDGVAVWLYDSSENTIEDNSIDYYGSGINPLYYGSRTNPVYYGAGIKLQNSHYNSITQNNITEYDYGFGVLLSTSIGNNLTKNSISNCYYGIRVYESSNNTIASNKIRVTRNLFLADGNGMRSNFGIRLHSASGNTITSNSILDTSNGIQLTLSSYFNTIENNTITNSTYSGIGLGDDASHNRILANKVSETKHGLEIMSSSNNTLKDNDISDNVYNLWVNGSELEHFIQNFDASNTLDDKPVYYWVNKHDLSVPSDAGYVALVNCTNVTIAGVEISNNYDGLLLVYTTNSTITKTVITGNYFGVKLYQSTLNNIFENDLKHNYWGVWLYQSTDNNITCNNIAENSKHGLRLSNSSSNIITENNIAENSKYGLVFSNSSNNKITTNNIINNGVGAGFVGSSNNVVYHNNFVNNKKHVEVTKNAVGYIPIPDGMHIFDNNYPSGGNYWDNYNGTDTNHDGIGDTSYLVSDYRNNTDDYPLIEPVEIETIPEFSSGLILIFVLAASLAIVLSKKAWSSLF
ncbi:MAG: hypothetical protein CW691_08615 [Candidatus Bathyarchaeum sp.]|nr:MAG: hypothetical protein CW691_08615 [Candidatus Bathyarchaeum sp.]